MLLPKFFWTAIVLLLFYNETTRALRSVVMSGGGAVKAGSRATFSCSYDLEGAQLYSIRWYRNQDEFYRYVPKETPPMLVFSLPGIHVDLSTSNDQRVTLTSVHRQLAGVYACEISADAPLFHTAIESTRLDVVDVPQSGPYLTVDRLRYSPGESIRANCSSPMSYPPANLTWFLNGEVVNKTFTTTLPLNPDLWEASSSFSAIEVSTEEPMLHPRYQVGGNQQETSSSQLKVPSSSPEITVYTAYSKIPTPLTEFHEVEYEKMKKDHQDSTTLRDYPLRMNSVPLKVTRIRLQPGFGGVIKLKCEATIFNVYTSNTEVVKIREETPHIALVMGQSSSVRVHHHASKHWLYVFTSISLVIFWRSLQKNHLRRIVSRNTILC